MSFELGGYLAAASLSVVLTSALLMTLLQTHLSRWQHGLTNEFSAGLRQSFLFVDSRQLFRWHVLMLVAGTGLALWWTRQVLWGLITILVIGALPYALLLVLRRRRRALLAHQLPDAVLFIAGCLRAGTSLPLAIRQSSREIPAPLGRELEVVIREQGLGVNLDAALCNLETRLELEDLTLFIAATRIAQETGGNLAEILERLGDTLRKKAVLEGKIDALTAQGRMQGWVMALLPLIVALALCWIEPDAMRPLYSTWQGGVFCAVIVLLELLGMTFIRKIVDIDV